MLIWSPGTTLEEVEKQVILTAYSHYKQKSTTAKALNIGIRTLDEKLKRYEQDDKDAIERREKYRLERRALAERHRSGTLAVITPAVTLEDENEERRQKYARERAEGKRTAITIPGVELKTREEIRAEADARLPVQSASEVAKEQPVPLQERREVQEMLSVKTSSSSSRGRR